MVSNLEARVSQQFKSKYERIVRMLRLKTDELIDDYQSNRILPYQLFSKLNQLLIEAAIELSHKRLELDCAELGKFDFTPREKVEWLKSNQFDCLFNKFWEGIVLDIYINQIHKIASGGFGSQSQMHPELRNIYNQIEREIEVMCLEPPIKEKQQVVMNNYNYQNNNGVIIHSEGQSRNTINVTYIRNYSAQIEELSTKFIELLKEADIPNDFKLDTIDLIETANEQIKNNKPRKGIIASLGEKIKLITKADSVIESSSNLIQYANQLWMLLKPLLY